MDDERSILKRGAKRTLWLRPGHGLHGDVVVKRFHAPGFFDRRRDPTRAEDERRTLQALFTRGLPVPEPLGIERHPEGVDLVMRSIEGARSIAAIVRDTPRHGGERIAREIGVLLARASACGLRHPDLHAGNVLVDADGRAWLVDLRGARIGGFFAWKEHEDALVVLAADLRERTSARDRMRVLISGLRYLERAGLDGLPRARSVAQSIENEARLRRRTVLARSTGRWLRNSSVTVLIERTRGDIVERGWRARGADETACWRCLDEPGDRACIAGSVRRVESAWRTAVRLHEHGLAVPAPLAIAFTLRGGSGPRARAVFGPIESGARPTRTLAEVARDHDRSDGARAAVARGLGTLLGTLFDRGLGLADPLASSVVFDAEGRASIAIGARVRSVDVLDRDASLRGARGLADRATPRDRARFLVAWLQAQTISAAERAQVRTRRQAGIRP